eukprot:NODE_3333_length_988_cov_6.406504_g3187_i0.p1 GENE.NODE_3333_length_988_cov_6.406504_g3187_i0~~NODE_3333_length_988_cov_6.406504_g3187_i0.p1  ORF type:complete len:181 (+),score=36.81 NODE_3333_length_988_cov_6.406504_g3187_i0:437-979(+)
MHYGPATQYKLSTDLKPRYTGSHYHVAGALWHIGRPGELLLTGEAYGAVEGTLSTDIVATGSQRWVGGVQGWMNVVSITHLTLIDRDFDSPFRWPNDALHKEAPGEAEATLLRTGSPNMTRGTDFTEWVARKKAWLHRRRQQTFDWQTELDSLKEEVANEAPMGHGLTCPPNWMCECCSS